MVPISVPSGCYGICLIYFITVRSKVVLNDYIQDVEVLLGGSKGHLHSKTTLCEFTISHVYQNLICIAVTKTCA